MKKMTWVGVAVAVVLALAGSPAAVGNYPCDQGCEDPPEDAVGHLDLCKTLEEGESGAQSCFSRSYVERKEDGSFGWAYICNLEWGACKEASGVWLYPIA